jgi:hypothetical protein
MSAASRKAYLAALGIPVWVSRERPRAPAAPVASARRPARSGAESLRALLGEGAGPQPVAAARRTAVDPDPVSDTARQDWILLRLDTSVLIADAGSAIEAATQREFLANLRFAISGERRAGPPEPFRWPPAPGMPADEASLGQALRGKFRALGVEPTVLHLFGDGVVGVVEPLLPGLAPGCRVDRHPDLATVMHGADAKRALWRALRRDA